MAYSDFPKKMESTFGTFYYLRTPSPPPAYIHNIDDILDSKPWVIKSKSEPTVKNVKEQQLSISGASTQTERLNEPKKDVRPLTSVNSVTSHSAPLMRRYRFIEHFKEKFNDESKQFQSQKSKSVPTAVQNNNKNKTATTASKRPKSAQTQLKRDLVRKAHYHITKSLQYFKIPQVSSSSGLRIVRICCRTPDQLQNIVPLLSDLIKRKLIVEIGMPLKYEYKMKSLVLFIKPTSIITSMQIEMFLKKSVHNYHVSVKDLEPPQNNELRPSILKQIKDCIKTPSSEVYASEAQIRPNYDERNRMLPNCHKAMESEEESKYLKLILIFSVVCFLFITTKASNLTLS